MFDTKRSWLTRRRFLAASSVAIAVSLAPGSTFAQAKKGRKKLNIYNFDTYIGENTLADFTARSGLAVRYDTYANNEELFAKLKRKNPGYDIIVPSDYMIETMIGAKILLALDHAKLPNLVHIAPAFADPPFDPGMKFSVPYMWGTVGIGYRKSKVQGIPVTWSYIFGPEANAYKGRIVPIDDMRVVLGAALKYLGYSLNTTKPEEIAKARDLVVQAKKNFKSFSPDSGQDMLLAGDADLVIEYNGDIVQVQRKDKDLAYVLPKEGGQRWTDCLCIPKGAPNVEAAHAFIDFVHGAKENAHIVNTIHYATPNAEGRKLQSAEDKQNPAIYPSEEALVRCETVIDLGKATKLYDQAWTKIKAS